MKIGIIGNEMILIRCLQHMMNYPNADIQFVIYDPNYENKFGAIQTFCEKNNIRTFKESRINTPSLIECIKKYRPDIIVSISNYWIMNREWLAIPPQGVINFHNAPPSRYHGLNIPSWVIINGEKEHGVMWHYAQEKVDAGDVIGFRMFPLNSEETAASLMVKCIQQGISLFKEIFEDILNERAKCIKQGKNSSFYLKSDLPENQGVLDFRWDLGKIERLVRGLNYIPFKNHFCHARIKTNSGEVIVNQVNTKSEKTILAPGSIVSIDDDEFRIACRDGSISVINAMNSQNEELDARSIADILQVKEGDIIE